MFLLVSIVSDMQSHVLTFSGGFLLFQFLHVIVRAIVNWIINARNWYNVCISKTIITKLQVAFSTKDVCRFKHKSSCFRIRFTGSFQHLPNLSVTFCSRLPKTLAPLLELIFRKSSLECKSFLDPLTDIPALNNFLNLVHICLWIGPRAVVGSTCIGSPLSLVGLDSCT